MAIRVIVSGVDTVIPELRELPKTAERTVLARMSQVAYDSAQKSIDTHHKTGALRRSLYNRTIPNGREVGNDPLAAPHAKFVHWGTKPHDIRPKNKSALRWVSGSAFVFSRVVHHPGYRGDPYLLAAADNAIRQFSALVDASFKELKP